MPSIRIRPRTLRRRLALVGLGALCAAGVVGMPTARADTVGQYAFQNAAAVCDRLDHDPNYGGLDSVTAQLVGYRISPPDAAAVIVLSVFNVCPRYLPMVTMYYAPTQAVAA